MLNEARKHDLKDINNAVTTVTTLRAKEAPGFSAAEAQLADIASALPRSIGIIEKEMVKNPAALAQMDTSSLDGLMKFLSVAADATAISDADSHSRPGTTTTRQVPWRRFHTSRTAETSSTCSWT